MRKSVSFLAGVALCTVLASCSSKKDDVVRIGLFEPMSGDNGAGGRQEALGAIYANEKIPIVKVGDKEYKVDVISIDSTSSNDKAIIAASELVSKGVSVVIGPYGSSIAIAASDTFEAANIPVIGATCSNPQVTMGNDHYFRVCFLDSFQGTVLANLAVEGFGAKTAYCLAKQGDDYSVGLSNYFIETFKRLGGSVVFETFPAGSDDFAPYIAHAKNTGVNVFYSPVSIEAATLIIGQAAAMKLGIPILAGDTWESNAVLNAIKGTDVDLNVTTFFSEGGGDEVAENFVAEFRSWINADTERKADNSGGDIIAASSVMAYDAYNVALEAIRIAGSIKSADIKSALPKVRYRGVTGLIEFDDMGDAKRDTAYIKHANSDTGEWEFLGIQTIRNSY